METGTLILLIIVAAIAGMGSVLDEAQTHRPLIACTLVGLVLGDDRRRNSATLGHLDALLVRPFANLRRIGGRLGLPAGTLGAATDATGVGLPLREVLGHLGGVLLGQVDLVVDAADRERDRRVGADSVNVVDQDNFGLLHGSFPSGDDSGRPKS